MAKSKAEKFAREYGSDERVAFVAQIPCLVCGEGPSQNHHVRTDGIGLKGPYTSIVPLCMDCHGRYHTLGRATLLARSRLILQREPIWVRCHSWEEAAEAVEQLWTER